MANKNKTEKRGPGRPMAVINIPNKKFTFADLCVANGVNPKTGQKEPNGKCTSLTLRKFLKRDMLTESGNPRPNSTIVLVKDERRDSSSEKGLGRKCLVYMKRDTMTKNVKVAHKASKKVHVPITPAQPAVDYEATKAALGITTPSPAPVESAV